MAFTGLRPITSPVEARSARRQVGNRYRQRPWIGISPKSAGQARCGNHGVRIRADVGLDARRSSPPCRDCRTLTTIVFAPAVLTILRQQLHRAPIETCRRPGAALGRSPRIGHRLGNCNHAAWHCAPPPSRCRRHNLELLGCTKKTVAPGARLRNSPVKSAAAVAATRPIGENDRNNARCIGRPAARRGRASVAESSYSYRTTSVTARSATLCANCHVVRPRHFILDIRQIDEALLD